MCDANQKPMDQAQAIDARHCRPYVGKAASPLPLPDTDTGTITIPVTPGAPKPWQVQHMLYIARASPGRALSWMADDIAAVASELIRVQAENVRLSQELDALKKSVQAPAPGNRGWRIVSDAEALEVGKIVVGNAPVSAAPDAAAADAAAAAAGPADPIGDVIRELPNLTGIAIYRAWNVWLVRRIQLHTADSAEPMAHADALAEAVRLAMREGQGES